MAELYKISVVDGKIMLRIPPQLVGAETANLDDIQADLHLMDVDYLPERLLEIHERSSGAFEFLCDQVTRDFVIQVELVNNEQEAYVNIIPPQNPQEPLTIDRILAALKEKNVVQGVDKERVQQMIDQQVYYDPTLVAHGRPPVDGADGYAELLFIPEAQRPPAGVRVNLREIPHFLEVKAGAPLARLHPPTVGEDGYTITGRVTAAASGKTYHIRSGRNTSYDATREHIVATKDGVVCQIGNVLSVEAVKVVEKVDAKSGHVRFDGVVRVRGNISDRFSVEGVSLDVGGTVGKAKLRATGNIRLAQAAIGSMIQAGGSVIADSFDEAQVIAGEHVLLHTHSINSKVMAGISIQVLEKTGYVTGGFIQAGNLMRLSNVGENKPEDELPPEEGASAAEEPSGPVTTIEVGISLNNRKAFRALEEKLKTNFYDFQDQLKELSEKLEGFPDRFPTPQAGTEEIMVEARKICRGLFGDMRKIEAQQSISRQNEELDGGILFINGRVQPGTVINIRRMRFNVMSPATAMAYQFVQTGIQARPAADLVAKHQHRFIKIPS